MSQSYVKAPFWVFCGKTRGNRNLNAVLQVVSVVPLCHEQPRAGWISGACCRRSLPG